MPGKRELDHAYRLRKLQIVQNLGIGLFRTASWVLPFFFLWLGLRELAGRQTSADIAFKAIADLRINRYLAQLLPWGTTTLATGWALGERWLRKRYVKRSASEFGAMHRKFDPSRRSSSLTTGGDTSPEDL
jgi:hypothetical protein